MMNTSLYNLYPPVRVHRPSSGKGSDGLHVDMLAPARFTARCIFGLSKFRSTDHTCLEKSLLPVFAFLFSAWPRGVRKCAFSFRICFDVQRLFSWCLMRGIVCRRFRCMHHDCLRYLDWFCSMHGVSRFVYDS